MLPTLEKYLCKMSGINCYCHFKIWNDSKI